MIEDDGSNIAEESGSMDKGPKIEPVQPDPNIPVLYAAAPNIWKCGNRELRHHTREVTNKVGDGGWMLVQHYRDRICAIVGTQDFDMLMELGSCASIDQLIDVFSRWERLGPASMLVNALKTTAVNAKVGASSGFSQKVIDFSRCEPSYQQDGSVRAVDFAGDMIHDAQLTLRGTAETGFSLNGFLERDGPEAKFALELPTGEVIDTFDEDGATLNLRRTPLSAPIALLDVRVRRL